MDNPGHLKQASLTDKIIKVFYEVYNELGFGFLESVYENALAIALADTRISVAQQAPIAV
jgi:GxxExxY protein